MWCFSGKASWFTSYVERVRFCSISNCHFDFSLRPWPLLCRYWHINGEAALSCDGHGSTGAQSWRLISGMQETVRPKNCIARWNSNGKNITSVVKFAYRLSELKKCMKNALFIGILSQTTSWLEEVIQLKIVYMLSTLAWQSAIETLTELTSPIVRVRTSLVPPDMQALTPIRALVRFLHGSYPFSE